MSKQKIEAGDGSLIFQANEVHVDSDILENTKKIKHCGKCKEFYRKKKMDNPFDDIYEHCNELQKISDVETYLVYKYKKISKMETGKYIKPTLSINEFPFELTPSSYYNYDDYGFFLSENYNLYLIQGEGGIGKSKFLSMLFMDLINKSFYSNNIIIPFLVDCDLYGNTDLSPRTWLFSTINRSFPNLDVESILSNQNYKVYFLIDAINSMQYENKSDFENKIKKWVHFVKECCESYENISFIITSRNINELSYFDSHRQRNISIVQLESEKINAFIDLFVEDSNLSSEVKSLVTNNVDMHFWGIPYFLLKIIESKKKDQKINNKTDIVLLYASYLFEKHNTLIKERERKKRKFNDKQFYDLLINKKLSFFEVIFYCAFICQENNKKFIDSEDIKTIEICFGKEINLILQIAVDEKILTIKSNKYTFSHPILQEFFAAMYIYADLENNYKLNKILPFEDLTMNLEIAPHLYNLVSNKTEFISTLIDSGNIVYAAECVVNNGKALKEKVAKAILEYLQSKSCSKDDIVCLSKYLGVIGDPRFKNDDNYIEPNTVPIIGLNHIKVAVYPITNKEFSLFIKDNGYQKAEYWKEASNSNWLDYETVINCIFNFWNKIRERFNTDKNAFENFCKSSAVDIEQCASLAYFLSMENAELLEMLRDLYKKETFSKPLFWDDPKYNNPSQPVVGISYFEAQAYCRWLSKKSNKKYRLLDKEEWEHTAKTKYSKYVFGNQPSMDYCNTIEAEYQTVLPVGVLMQNITSDGVYDINGNVFEWTSSIYKYGNSLLDTQMYVKGGSWVQNIKRATSKYDGRAKTWCRNLDVGFRVCLDEN